MFKNIVLGIFIAGALFGLLVFSGAVPIGNSNSSSTNIQGTVVMWGTFNKSAILPFLNDFKDNNPNININYIEKDSSTYSDDIINSIADGNPPDLLILPDNLIFKFKDKIVHVPYSSIPSDVYDNTFISSASIFKANDGIVAFPWAADPLIMYYNRDMLQTAGYAVPPSKWQAFTDSVKVLTQKKSDSTIIQSATALGTYSNIAHAKDMLALLFLQTGNPFVGYDYSHLVAYLGDGRTKNEASIAQQVMDFYMAFSDPLKIVYSWNAGEPLDRDMFTQSNLAYYFGTASELPGIRATNPNLNFGIALPPQSDTSNISVTTGHMYGFAVTKASQNKLLALTAASLLTSTTSETSLGGNSAVTLALLPSRRDVLANSNVSDPYLNFLYKSVLVQKSWFDPDPVKTDKIFGQMISDISSSLLSTPAALSKAETQIDALDPNNVQ